jgi:hypothetical protein
VIKGSVFTLHACARDELVCVSVVIVIVIAVRTKTPHFGDVHVGPWVSSNTVKNWLGLAWLGLKSNDTGHEG